MIHDIHHVPGRLRIRIPELKRNVQALENIVALAKPLNGIRSVELNPLTSSILIRYHPAQISAPGILRALKLHGPLPPRPVDRPFAGRIVEALLWHVLDRALGALI